MRMDAARRAGGGLVAAIALVLAVAGCTDPAPSGHPVLAGVVLLPDGSPCSDCHTGVTSPEYPMPEIAQRTGDDGSFEWSLPGEGVFTVEATGHGSRVEETVTVGEGDVAAVELRLK